MYLHARTGLSSMTLVTRKLRTVWTAAWAAGVNGEPLAAFSCGSTTARITVNAATPLIARDAVLPDREYPSSRWNATNATRTPIAAIAKAPSARTMRHQASVVVAARTAATANSTNTSAASIGD